MPTFPATGPVTLRTNLADSQLANALKTGEVSTDLVAFDFCGPKTANQGFKPMVREGKFDAGELAIVTFMQALDYGKPLVLLPATMVGRFQHQFFVCRKERAPMDPKTLEGKRVAVRSYTQTTGVWVRGILQNDYGVDLDRIQWVAFEDPHVPECVEPPNVTRAPAGKTLTGMLRSGELDAGVVMVSDQRDGLLKPVIPEPSMALHRWRVETQARPLNHVVVVHRNLARSQPWVGEEVVRLLQQSAALVPDMPGADSIQSGIEELRSSLDLIIHYAYQQGLIPRRFAVDELFNM